MQKLTGAQVLVRCLIDQGVDTIFGYPGGTVLDIYDALYDHTDQIHHVETTHEQHACHAADGYARSTGRTGVVIATSGPGATNLVTGIATAYLDSIPLVAITGNVGNGMIGTDAFQELDITGVTLPITKHNYFVRDVTRLQDIVCEAFKLANSGRKGPVLVDIPADVQRERVPYEPKTCSLTRSTATPDPADLEAAAAVINKSKRPFVYFGGGVVSSGAGDEVIELANLINAPIGCSLMGISGIPTNTPRFLGMEGMHGHYASTKAMNQCDCLIALGARFNDRSTGDRARFAPSGKVVRVDIDSSEFSKTLDDLKAEYMGTSESADAISNKQLDGVWVMAGTPNAAVTQIMTTTDAKILPIPAETVEALKVNYPWYASYTIPAGTYAGQDEDVPTSAVKLTLFITADVDEETVYQMTKTFWENWDYLTETHAALKKASLEAACTDLAGVPIHEGAARYYREVGVLE